MKSLYLLTKQLETWRTQFSPSLLFSSWGQNHSPSYSHRERKLNLSYERSFQKVRPPVMFAIAVFSFTGVVGYRFINQPKLDVGTIAPQKIYAPTDAQFEDTKTTEETRRAIRTAIVPTLKRDLEVTRQINQEIKQFIQKIDQIRYLAGAFPFVEPQLMSLSMQQYLRQCQDWEWQTILKRLQGYQQLPEAGLELSSPNLPQFNSAITQAATELKSYQRQTSPLEFADLITRINRARKGYTQAKAKIKAENVEQERDWQSTLLEIPDRIWWETRSGILQASQKIVTQGISPGIPPQILTETIQLHLSPEVPESISPIAIQLLEQVLQPNLTEDKEETKRKAEQAAQAVKPVVLKVKKGELIVDEGEIITQKDFVLLDNFDLSRRGVNWQGLGKTALLVTGAVGIFVLVLYKLRRPRRCRDHLLLCLLSLSTPLLLVFQVPYTNLPAVSLLISGFYGPTLAVTQVTLVTGLASITNQTVNWEYLLAGAMGGLLAAMMGGKLHSREELAMLGVGIGLTQGTVALIVNLIISSAAGTIWNVLLPEAIIYGVSGLVWAIIALGISPYLERLFDLLTPIRLAELSNPNRPLLKRLATEAPGTFQHTMFVASLAEAAARELNCNVELVRAGALYHDIGKMHDPLGFIENQMGEPNKHNEINDSWISASIIKKHVSEGLVMARKYNLPKAIRDFIPEHQGKLLISYFYFQAKQQAKKDGREVLESDFRYDGPIPQSRETGILMLADACEAALRSLKSATPEQALTTIKKIFKARWEDHQLVDSGIRKEELPHIAQIFVRVWQQFNHQRIAYPKAALEAKR